MYIIEYILVYALLSVISVTSRTQQRTNSLSITSHILVKYLMCVTFAVNRFLQKVISIFIIEFILGHDHISVISVRNVSQSRVTWMFIIELIQDHPPKDFSYKLFSYKGSLYIYIYYSWRRETLWMWICKEKLMFVFINNYLKKCFSVKGNLMNVDYTTHS